MDQSDYKEMEISYHTSSDGEVFHLVSHFEGEEDCTEILLSKESALALAWKILEEM